MIPQRFLAFVVGRTRSGEENERSGRRGDCLELNGGILYICQIYAGHGNSKNAVETMVKNAATELGEWGIRVNAVSGGPIDTDALKAFPDYAEVKAKVKRSSLRSIVWGRLKI